MSAGVAAASAPIVPWRCHARAVGQRTHDRRGNQCKPAPTDDPLGPVAMCVGLPTAVDRATVGRGGQRAGGGRAGGDAARGAARPVQPQRVRGAAGSPRALAARCPQPAAQDATRAPQLDPRARCSWYSKATLPLSSWGSNLLPRQACLRPAQTRRGLPSLSRRTTL